MNKKEFIALLAEKHLAVNKFIPPAITPTGEEDQQTHQNGLRLPNDIEPIQKAIATNTAEIIGSALYDFVIQTATEIAKQMAFNATSPLVQRISNLESQLLSISGSL